MPAVLDREHHLLPVPTELVLRPAQQLQIPGVGRAERPVPAELTADVVDRDRAVSVLVDVDPNHDHHEEVSSRSEGRLGRPADTPQWGRSHAPIKSRRSALTSTKRHNP